MSRRTRAPSSPKLRSVEVKMSPKQLKLLMLANAQAEAAMQQRSLILQSIVAGAGHDMPATVNIDTDKRTLSFEVPA